MTAELRERIAGVVRDSLLGSATGLLFDILIEDLQSQAQVPSDIPTVQHLKFSKDEIAESLKAVSEMQELQSKRAAATEEMLSAMLERFQAIEKRQDLLAETLDDLGKLYSKNLLHEEREMNTLYERLDVLEKVQQKSLTDKLQDRGWTLVKTCEKQVESELQNPLQNAQQNGGENAEAQVQSEPEKSEQKPTQKPEHSEPVSKSENIKPSQVTEGSDGAASAAPDAPCLGRPVRLNPEGKIVPESYECGKCGAQILY